MFCIFLLIFNGLLNPQPDKRNRKRVRAVLSYSRDYGKDKKTICSICVSCTQLVPGVTAVSGTGCEKLKVGSGIAHGVFSVINL